MPRLYSEDYPLLYSGCGCGGCSDADALKADFGRFLDYWPGEYYPLPAGARPTLVMLKGLNEGADPLAPLWEFILEELGL